MRYPTQEKLQKVLMFERQLRIDLPEAATHEALSILAALIAAVMGESDRAEDDGGRDE